MRLSKAFRTLWLAAALPALAAVPVRSFDNTAPVVTGYSVTDCEGNWHDNAVTTTTGTPNFRITVQDAGTWTGVNRSTSGLRFGRSIHVGGDSGFASTVLLLHLDEGNASVFIDSSSYSNNGADAGTSACVDGDGFTGKAGDGCRIFAETSDNIKLTQSTSLGATYQLTLQAWINPDTVDSSSGGYPILEYNNAAEEGVSLWHSVGKDGDLYATIIDTNNFTRPPLQTEGGHVTASGDWQLVTFVYTGADIYIFHNNDQVAHRGLVAGTLATDRHLFVGYRASGGTSETFRGKIDEVRVLNGAILEKEVANDYYSGRFDYSTQSTTSSFTTVLLSTGAGGHYLPTSADNGWMGVTTVTVNGVPLSSGPANFVRFSFQDMAGNTIRRSIITNVSETPPSTPALPVAQATGVDTIDWSWSRGSRLCLIGGTSGQFRLYDAFDHSLTTGPLAQGFDGRGFYTEPDLSTNTLYGRQVAAVDDYGESALTPPTTVYTLAAAPSGISFTGISTGGAAVSWNSENPSYTRWELSLSTDNFATLISSPVRIEDDHTATSAGLTGLFPNTTYYVRVRAKNGRSSDFRGAEFTAFDQGSFPTLTPAPGSPNGEALGISSIAWSWSAVPTATSYSLESSTGGTLAVTGATSFIATGLQTNEGYQARLRSDNASGSSPFSPLAAKVYTLAEAPGGTAVVSATTDTIAVSWSANTNPGGTNYETFVATDSTFGNIVKSVGVNTNSALLRGLLPGSLYWIRVRARNGNDKETAYDTPVSTRTANYSAVSTTGTPATPYTPPDGTVAVWHFDESSGTATEVVIDSSGYANHGALACSYVGCSTPSYTTGMSGFGYAVRFTGIQDTLCRVPHSATLGTTGDLSVEAWVRPSQLAQSLDAGIVVKGSGTFESFALDIDAFGRWRFSVRDAGTALYSVTSTQTVRPGTWTYLAGVYEAGAGASLGLYVDGGLSASTALAPAARRNDVHDLAIGNRQQSAGSYNRGFKGDIDEVHLSTRVLSASEVSSGFASVRPAEVTIPSPNEGIRLTIPPDAFGANAVILVSSNPLTSPINVSPLTVAEGIASPPADASGQDFTLVPDSIIEIVPKVGGSAFTGELGSSVTVTIPYPDADGNLLVDGTSPPVPVRTLEMYRLNPAVSGRWEKLSPLVVDTAQKRVHGGTIHFSVFALFGPTQIQPNAEGAFAYPVPWKPGSGGDFDSAQVVGQGSGLAFGKLPTSGTVRIFTLSGEMVVELPFRSPNAGALVWDGKNGAGRKVASGVYFAYVKGDDGSTTIVKFAIER
ncbi:MAG: LamG-like jellyroll fold domain-containing protein [Elusimicrobiota bacterium]